MNDFPEQETEKANKTLPGNPTFPSGHLPGLGVFWKFYDFLTFSSQNIQKTQHQLCAHNRNTWACKGNWTDGCHIKNCVPNLRRVGWVKSAHMDTSSDCHFFSILLPETLPGSFRGKCVSFFHFLIPSPVCCGCYPGWGCIIIPIGSPGDLVQLARHEWLSRTRNWKS